MHKEANFLLGKIAIKTMIEINKINQLCKKLDNTYSINQGGCCYLSYLIANVLENKRIPYKIAIQGECTIKDAEKTLKSKLCKSNCSKCCWVNNYHFLLKTKNGYINKLPSHDVLYIGKSNANEIFEIYKNTKWKENYSIKNNETIKSIVFETLKNP